jgi:hypothetical protein
VFNASQGAVTLDLDQRVASVTDADICLLNSAGDPVANQNPVSASIPTQSAGPEAVVLQFVGGPTGPVAEAAMISIGCNSTGETDPATAALASPLFTTNDANPQDTNGTEDAWAVGQIVAPVGSAARLRAVKVTTHKAKKSKKAKKAKKAHRKARSKKA